MSRCDKESGRPAQGLCDHLPVEGDEASPHVDPLERIAMLIGSKIFALQNLQVDLTEPSLNLVRHSTPL